MRNKTPKLIRITTVPISLKLLLTGQMKYMKSQGYYVLTVSANGPEISDVKSCEDVDHLIVPMTRAITPIQDFKCLVLLYRLFKKEKPNIVHSHTPKAGLLGMLAARFAGVPVRIHTVAGLPLMTALGFKRNLLSQIEKLTYWGAHQIWPNSQSIYRFMLENKLCQESKMKIIGKGSTNGIDLSVFSEYQISSERLNEIKNIINYNPSCKYILAVGRVVKDKGIIELINSFIKLSSNNSNLRLILLGPIEEERPEEQLPPVLINEIKNNSSITHINWSSEVAYYMHLSDVLVHASYREGFPNVVLQAGAMKLPIVCSRIPGNIDIVDHLDTGYVFEMKNEEELSKGICWMFDHPTEVKIFTLKLRKKIEASFDRKRIHEMIYNEYTRLLN